MELLREAMRALVRVDGKLLSYAAWIARELRVGSFAQRARETYVKPVTTPFRHRRTSYCAQVLLRRELDHRRMSGKNILSETRANRGIYAHTGSWIPAFAGMTGILLD